MVATIYSVYSLFHLSEVLQLIIGGCSTLLHFRKSEKKRQTDAHEPDKKTQNPAEQIAKFAKEYRKICWKNNP
jgi:hypothetical protein